MILLSNIIKLLLNIIKILSNITQACEEKIVRKPSIISCSISCADYWKNNKKILSHTHFSKIDF